MTTSALRIRFLSFTDSEKQLSPDVVLYVKKLVQVLIPNESAIKLEEKGPDSSVVLSFNEAFDLFVDDEFYQVLFIASKTKQALADLILKRDDLISQYLNDPRYEKNAPLELLRTAVVGKTYTVRFSLRLHENVVKGKQLFRDHTLNSEHFHQPVSCAICHKFIWGILLQGYQCSRCSLVTHRKCYLNIPFDCLKAPPLLTSDPSVVNRQDQLPIEHKLVPYRAPLFQSIIRGEKNYCNHCGSQVLWHALKCNQCHFFVHENCRSNVPPMCTGSSGSRVTIVSEDPSVVPLPSPPQLSSLPKFADFECFGRLGSGRYGHVYCTQHLASGKYLAIKVVDGSTEEARQQFAFEKQILLHYHHENPYIITGYCSFHCGSNLFLGMELIDGETLREKIQRTCMNEAEARSYLVELISAVQYLHSRRIIYRDLKLENVLINSGGHIRLIDYGLGRVLAHPEQRCRTICGTPAYLAPEIRMLDRNGMGDGYNHSVDYWTLGMVFGQMLADKEIEFDLQLSLDNDGQFDPQTIVNAIARLPSDISLEARACLGGLLELDPSKRLGMPQSPHGKLREHQFFTVRSRIDWEEIDEGASKSEYRRLSTSSETSTTMPFPSLSFDRTALTKGEWVTAGRARFTASEDEQWKSFDSVNESAWSELELELE